MLICVQNIVTKNFICNETVSCFEGRIGFPCLANKPGEFSQNILPSASNVCRTFYFIHYVLIFPLKTTVTSDHFIAAIIIRRSVFYIGRVTFCHFHNYHRIPSSRHQCYHQCLLGWEVAGACFHGTVNWYVKSVYHTAHHFIVNVVTWNNSVINLNEPGHTWSFAVMNFTMIVTVFRARSHNIPNFFLFSNLCVDQI